MADGGLPAGITLRRPPPAGITLRPPAGITLRAPVAPVEAPVVEEPPPVFPLDAQGLIPPRPYNYPSEVPGVAAAPPPAPEPPSGIGEFLTQTGAAFGSGVATQGVTNLYGVAAADQPLIPGINRYRQQLKDFLTWPEEQRQAFRLSLERDHSMAAKTAQSMVSDLLDDNMRPEEVDTVLGPDPVATPMRQRPAFQAAKEAEAWQNRALGATPNYQSGAGGVYRGVMEGLGTLAASAGTFALAGPWAAGASALLAGVGETVQNIYSDENIAAAEDWQRGIQGPQAGLSSPSMADLLAGQGADQMAGLGSPGPELEMQRRVDAVLQGRLDKGAGLGLAAGGTDLLPLETLFNLLPGMKGASRIAKVAAQAFTEGGQEGVQQLLQNTAVGQALSSGLVESVGLGGSVGAISQVISELIQLGVPGRDRSNTPTPGLDRLTPEQVAALGNRLQPSQGGRLDVDQPELPMDYPVQYPPGGVQPSLPMELPEVQAPIPGQEQYELPLEQPGTPPTVQPVPGPGPSEAAPVTSDAVLAAYNAAKASEQYPVGDPRRTAAHENYYALVARFVTESEGKKPTGPVVGPTPARPEVEPGQMPAAKPATDTEGETAGVTPPDIEAPEQPPAAPAEGLPPMPSTVAAPAPRVSILPSEAEPPLPTEPAMTFPPRPVEGVGKPAPAETPKPTVPRPPVSPPVAEPALARTEPAKPKTPKELLGPPPPEPRDLLSFIIEQGGLQPHGDLKGQDAIKSRPGIINKTTGKTIDQIQEAMTQAGYFGSTETGLASEADALTQINYALGGEKIYPQTAVDSADVETRRRYEERRTQIDQTTTAVNAAIEEYGFKLSPAQHDEAVVTAFSRDPEDIPDIVSNIVERDRDREEPAPAQTVPTEDAVPFDVAPTDKAKPAEEPGAEGKPQLVMPGTEEQEVKGKKVASTDELHATLMAGGIASAAAVAPNGTRYSIRKTPDGRFALRVGTADQLPKTSHFNSREDAASAAVKSMARQQSKSQATVPQKGMAGTGLFGDEHKQTGLDLTPAPAPAKREEPKPEPKKIALSLVGRRDALGNVNYYVARDGKVPEGAKPHRIAQDARKAMLALADSQPDMTVDLRIPGNLPGSSAITDEPDTKPVAKGKAPTSLTNARARGGYGLKASDFVEHTETGRRGVIVGWHQANNGEIWPAVAWGRDSEELVDPALLNSTTGGTGKKATERLEERAGPPQGELFDEVDTTLDEADAQDDEDVEHHDDVAKKNATPTRIPRGGGTATFESVSTSEDTPLSERSAYADAGVDPSEALASPPRTRIKILSDLFKTKFGFNLVSIEGSFGEARMLDAIDHLVDGYRGIRMMMNVLGFPEKAASLGGSLSLTVGRRTKRASFLGMYDPNNKGIELTGRANSFAHEWGHAFDHWLMETINPVATGLASKWTRSLGLDPAVSLESHFINVMNAIFFDDAKFATRVLDLQLTAAKVHPPGHKTLAGKPTKAALKAQQELDDIAAGRGQMRKERSEYHKTSLAFGRGDPYWTNPAEMLARAFEAYVAYKTQQRYPGFKSNFISKGDEAYWLAADKRLKETFPQAVDRYRIFSALDSLVAQVNSRTALAGTPAAMPTQAELLDPDALYAHAAHDQEMKEEKARQGKLLSRLHNKLMSFTSLTGWRQMLDTIRDDLSGRFGAERGQISWGRSILTGLKGFIQSEAAMAQLYVNRKENAKAKPYLQAIGDQMVEMDPGQGRHLRETWPEAVTAFSRKYSGRLKNILKAHQINPEVPINPTTAEGQRRFQVMERLNTILTTGRHPPGTRQEEIDAAAAIRQLYDEMYREARRAGLDLGYVANAGYLPVIPSANHVHKDPNGFVAQATKVYQLVFDKANGPLHSDPQVVNDAITDIKHGRDGETPLKAPAVDAAIKLTRKLQKQINKLGSQMATASDPDAIQAQIDQLSLQITDAYDDLAAEIGPIWAEMRAKAWLANFINGEVSSMDTLGPQTRHVKSRTLPAEAQEIMKDFYISDPIKATAVYINSMGRKIAYAERFGKQAGGDNDLEYLLNRKNSTILEEMRNRGWSRNNPDHRVRAILELTDPSTANRLDMLITEAREAGAVVDDMTHMRDMVEAITGQRRDNSGPARQVANFLYTVGQMALMPRAVFTSLAEPVTVLIRTGDLGVAGATLAHYGKELVLNGARMNGHMRDFLEHKETTIQDIHDVAVGIGLVASEAQDAMLQVAMGDMQVGAKQTKVLSSFFEIIGLAGLTRVQRRAALVGGELWVRKLLKLATGVDPGNAAVAKADLAELGISEDQIQPMIAFLAPIPSRQVTIEDTKTPMGLVWSAAMRRFVSSSIQESTKGTAPRWASSHPLGRLAFGLTKFAYAFTRNILVRTAASAERDYALRRGAGESHAAAYLKSARDNLFMKYGVGFSALYLGQFLVSWLREWIFNHEQFVKHGEEGDWLQWMSRIAASRTGITGAWDTAIQGVAGITYQRDITALTAGPYTNLLLSQVQAVVQYLNPENSPKTNTAERNLFVSSMRLFANPLVSAGIAIAPGGKWAMLGLAGVGWLGTSNTMTGILTDAVIGPKTKRGGGGGDEGI